MLHLLLCKDPLPRSRASGSSAVELLEDEFNSVQSNVSLEKTEINTRQSSSYRVLPLCARARVCVCVCVCVFARAYACVCMLFDICVSVQIFDYRMEMHMEGE